MRIVGTEERELRNNLIRGLTLGLLMASGLTAWVTIVRLTLGPDAFALNGISYGKTVCFYFVGFAIGGIALGPLLPLRKWALGSMLLGFIFVLPVYATFIMLHAARADRFSNWNILGTLFGSLVTGGIVGFWVWSDQKKGAMIGEIVRTWAPS